MKTLFVALFCLLSTAAFAGDELRQEMDLAEAYRATNVQQKTFDLASSNMIEAEKRYLADLFAITDLAVIERVGTQTSLRTHDKVADNYRIIMARVDALAAPARLVTVHQQLRNAIALEREYLDGLRRGLRFDAQSQPVQSVHNTLLWVYGELQRLYPQEGTGVREAFYAHLCALDFI
ncbi:MAG: hypothetical protein PSY14_16065 [bacterium]|nr:hypothetical protein [bacterium]